MNIGEDNQSKLPGKSAARGNSVSKGNQNQVLNNASIVKRQRGTVSIQNKNLVARDGESFCIKRNVTLDDTEQLSPSIKRRLSHSKIIRNVQHKKLPKNAFPIRRKVEFDAGALEGEGVQDYYMGNVNYGFENTSGKVPLLPTPLIDEQIFPPYNDNTLDMEIYDTNEIGLSRENEMILNYNSLKSFSKVPLLPTPLIEERILPIDDNINMRFHNSSRRGLSRENEMFNNQNRNHKVYTESYYQAPVNEDAYYNHRIDYESTDNYNIHQDSLVFHSHYDNMYDQGRIDRNYSEISGRLSPLDNQRGWKSSFYSSSSAENKFGFVGYPFKKRKPLYKEPIEYERNSRNKRNFVELSRQSTSQGEKSGDTFYSYRPHDKESTNVSKGGNFGKGLIDILSGSFNTMNSGNSSSNFEQNPATSYENSGFFENEAESFSHENFLVSKDLANKLRIGNDSVIDSTVKRLQRKRMNVQHELNLLLMKEKEVKRYSKELPPSLIVKKEKLQNLINKLNKELSILCRRR